MMMPHDTEDIEQNIKLRFVFNIESEACIAFIQLNSNL